VVSYLFLLETYADNVSGIVGVTQVFLAILLPYVKKPVIIIIIIINVISCHRPFLPGTSIEQAVIPAAQASSLLLLLLLLLLHFNLQRRDIFHLN
jgi:hypothetical protein